MFSQISWAGYIQTILVILAVYYPAILFIYYRRDVVLFLSGRQQIRTAGSIPSPLKTCDPRESKEGNEMSASTSKAIRHYDLMVESLIEELKAFIIEAGRNGFDKNGIVSSIQILLHKYPSVNSFPYKESIGNLIQEECQVHCSVSLSEKDIVGLWES